MCEVAKKGEAEHYLRYRWNSASHRFALTTEADMTVDKDGNCPACGPEGCGVPQNHADAELENVKKLLSRLALEMVGQQGRFTMALAVVENALNRKEHRPWRA